MANKKSIPNDLYRNIFDASLDAVILVEEEGLVILRSSLATQRILGYKDCEITGKKFSVLFPHKSQEVHGKIEHYDTVITDQFRKADGSICTLDLTATIIPRDGKNAILVTLRDSSDRMKAEEERKQLIAKLQEAQSEVKTLSGLLPICASCKKIRDDKGDWGQIEMYIAKHSEASFTHGLCPECMEEYCLDMNKLLGTDGKKGRGSKKKSE